MDHQHVEQRRQSQAHRAITQERSEPFAIESGRDEIPGNEKQQTHKECLEKNLERGENDRDEDSRFWILHEVPTPEVAVGDRGMHANHQHNHGPAQVIDKLEPRFGRDLRGGQRAN